MWENRNNKVFKNKYVSVDQAEEDVKFRVVWWFKHYAKGSKDTVTAMLLNIKDLCIDVKPAIRTVSTAWLPPALITLKFNVYGSALGKPGQVGIGGVLRDFKGNVLCSFSLFIGVHESNTAEIKAIQKACALCVSNYSLIGRKIEVISDSNVAVSWVNNGGFGNINHVDTIYDIRSNLAILAATVVSFASRDSNHMADRLAKMGSSKMGEFVLWGGCLVL
ncbi:hypothetical protein Dsin_002531 [Dipteronia sinensis]|uniref:RNase H type-1 domain-containing protein n=1 Tax=Dipteronia sinensis TaxID=43782 RepID=A0AAE0ELB8_9ROSI|nr:hypothetical protein Dsin_002531 [Dipteronia sinensis]